jgi:hypothetical protein
VTNPIFICSLPRADYTNMTSVRQLLKTPGPGPKSLTNDLINVMGMKQLMATPRGPAKEPYNDLTDVQVRVKLDL